MMERVIDVSEFQGEIDWDKVKADGVFGVIVRAGYGRGNVDERAKVNLEGALSAGLTVGAYWFSYAYTPAMAKREAKFCNDVLTEYKDRLKLPVFFDWEDDSWKYAEKKKIKPKKELITAMNEEFCAEIRRLGYDAGYYLNKNYADNFVDESRLTEYKRWLAWWTREEQKDCFLWQYSDKGSVVGISGDVDMDTLWGQTAAGGASPANPGETGEEPSKPGTGASGSPDTGGYTVGHTYTVIASALNVRTGAGKGYPLVGYANLTPDGKRHAYGNGALMKGTRVTVQDIKMVGSDVWLRIPSGWICGIEGNRKFVE